MDKSEVEPNQIFDFVGYHFNLNERKLRPTLERWQTLNLKIKKLHTSPSCQTTYVPNRPLISTGQFRSDEAKLVAPEKPLGDPRIPGKCDPNPKYPSPMFGMVVQSSKHPSRSATTPSQICYSGLYRYPKRRLSCSHRRPHSKMNWVSPRKQVAYKPGNKGGLLCPKRVLRSLFIQHNTHSSRHHNSSLDQQ